MRAFGVRAGKKAEAAARAQQDVRQMESLGQRLLNDRIVTEGTKGSRSKAKNVVLMPAAMVEQLERHLRPPAGCCSSGSS